MSWREEAARAAKAAEALRVVMPDNDLLEFEIPSADANLDELEIDEAMMGIVWEGDSDWRRLPKAHVLGIVLKDIAESLEAEAGLQSLLDQ